MVARCGVVLSKARNSVHDIFLVIDPFRSGILLNLLLKLYNDTVNIL